MKKNILHIIAVTALLFVCSGSLLLQGQIVDIDGNTYNAIVIGNQTWMGENLKVTRLRDGTNITNVTLAATWISTTSPAYCWYNNTATYKDIYGALYNWQTVNTGNLCPTGYHVPTNDEWTILVTYLGGESVAGGKLKEAGTAHWLIPNIGATNESGFKALPGGTRMYNDGTFASISGGGLWWTSTAVPPSGNYWGIVYDDGGIGNYVGNQRFGMSVRCLRNMKPYITSVPITSISLLSAQSGGNITGDGGMPVTARGVCWSTSPNPTITLDNHTIDGSGIGSYTSNLTGLTPNTTYYVRAYATNSLGDGYGNEISFTTLPCPTISITISGTTAVCKDGVSPNITFTGTSGTAPFTIIYNINGGGNQTVTTITGNSISISAPTGSVGTFSYNLVSAYDAIGSVCSQTQSGSAVVTVNPLPTATISGTTAVCKDAASPNITFTGASGTAPYTFTYTINSGSNQTVTTTVGNSVTVAVPTVTAGTYTYALVSVLDASSTACSQTQSGSAVVTVNPLPTATISGTTAVCKDAPSANITFTGASGTAPYTFTYIINGGSNQTVTTTVGNSVTVAVPNGAAGTFTYNLVSVQDASACLQAQTGSATVTVSPLPTATISGTTAVCKDAVSPNITFTGASGTAPYTFTYTINSGSNQTVTTTDGNSVTVAALTGAAGIFTYALVSVRDASIMTCSQTQSGRYSSDG